MDINIFYKPNIIILFTDNFENIKNIFTPENYDWELFTKIFNNLFIILSNQNIDENNFIKYYYLFTFLYLSYTNYLVYINHKDVLNPNIDKMIKKFKTSHNIINNIFRLSSNEHITQIIKLSNIFILKKLKKNNYSVNNNFTENYINDIKQFFKISELDNSTHKKILNLIIYRFIACKNNNYNTYHNFYINKIISLKNNYSIMDFDFFINQIPKSRKLLNIIVNEKTHNTKIHIEVIDIINFILKKKNNFNIKSSEKNCIIIKNTKIEGFIKINISDNYDNIEFNQFQSNYNFIHYNLEPLKEFSFLKKSFSNIVINIPNNIFLDLSSVLEFIHLLTVSIKILSNVPSDLYECIYPLDYTNYYFDSFCLFLEFIKSNINNNFFYNKFIYDVIKFLYIYSYYDYYFYYSNSLIDTIINKLEFKNEIFIEFINNLKNVLKLPKELLSYPPFFNNDFDINSIIYYNFEMPSYFKLFDFINAICHVFNKKKYEKNNKINFTEILLENIFIDNKNTYLNSISKSISLNKELYNNNSSNNSNSSDNSNSNSNSSNDSNSSDNSNSNSNSSDNSNSSTSSSSLFELDSSIIFSNQINKLDNKNKSNNKNKSDNKNKLNKNKLNKNKSNDIESNLGSDIINNLSKQDIKQMSLSNTYIELNLNPNISDCVFNTDI